MNKNQRIASILNNISNEFQQIAKIVLEVDAVSASTGPDKSSEYWKGYTASAVKAAADHLFNVQTVEQSNKGADLQYNVITDTYSSKVCNTPVQTAAGIPKRAEFVSENRQPSIPEKFDVVYGETDYLKEITRNRKSIFYKITQGRDCGAVIVVSRYSNKVTRDGRMTASTKSNSQLALVSKDRDGINYARGVRNTLLNRGYNKKQSRLVRYYRPCHAGKGNYKMAVIYRKNRNDRSDF